MTSSLPNPHHPNSPTVSALPEGETLAPDASNLTSSSTFTGASTTGSWADSTHSVIWMTRGGMKRELQGTQQPWAKYAATLVVIALLMLIAQANLLDVYGTPMPWAIASVTSTLLGALIALAGMQRSMRLWWQIVFLVVSQFIIGPVITLNSTTITHIIPSLDTLSQGWDMTFGSFKYLISIEPPIGTADGSLMAVWTIGLWLTFLAGVFALNQNAWLSLVSVLPLTTGISVCALLGTHTGWYRVISGIVFAVLLIVWLSWRLSLMEWGRWLSAIIIVVLACALAFAGTILVAQNRMILRDHYDPPISPYDYTSPLSGMRSYIKEHKDDVLLTATNLPAGTPVRLAVMDRFDGSVWNLSDASEASDSSNYRRVGTTIANNAQGKEFTAQFTVHEGLSDTWLPLAGAASSVQFTHRDDANTFYYNSDTDSAIFSSGTRKGMTYTESGIVPTIPSDKEISKAKAAQISQPQTQDVPDSASKLATSIAGGQSSGGAAAEALASTLRDSGWFSHGLKGDYPSEAGHGNYRIDKLLAGTAMVGDSEQYASAMALMARELGLPSRVVLGFLPKDKEGNISDARTKTMSGNTTKTEFTGNDVTAWVEIKLQGYGWVAFYPTPKETKIPDENQNLAPPNPQTLVRQPPVPLTDPLRDQTQAKSQSSLSGADADAQPPSLFWLRFWRVTRAVALYGSPLWIVLIICGLILAFKALLLARARRYGSPQTRVASGWNAVCALAAQCGVSVQGTRRDQADGIARELNTSHDVLHQLSREADYATFSGQSIESEQASHYWAQVDALRKAMFNSLPRFRRIKAQLSLRNVRILAHKRTMKPRTMLVQLVARRHSRGKAS
ncbi:transglutaminase domain-containing protein [Bifidobacterium sp. LC6]|uniref:Transglutaminase domain-containing protein n=1 Tax=Bifidobacterium colobi TaxID=2809026 RepID=A0ABS5UU18_9BIFI|nr:transglutaminase domain-containing protein [Bifidobacterium colobi]MBT1174522.1 transglutaminase domain-containing protein [Bifidobacterium colobi]